MTEEKKERCPFCKKFAVMAFVNCDNGRYDKKFCPKCGSGWLTNTNKNEEVVSDANGTRQRENSEARV